MSLSDEPNGRKAKRDSVNGDHAAQLPDVTGMSIADAAEEYAKAGIHIVPIRIGTKNPGSYLGAGWPARATCDLDTVRDWWRRWPDAGIAMHVGGSLLLVIDVDHPELLAEWMWPLLERAVFRPTTNDPNSRRGHYFYRLRSGQVFGCGRGGLKPRNGEAAGFDVKCYGGAIVVAPTQHLRAHEGGQYATGPAGLLPLVPDDIADKLNPAPSNGEARMLTPAELGEKATTFLDTYTDDDQAHALAPILRTFNPTPGERHTTMFDALCWAMREAKAGRFPARHAVDELRKLWDEATRGREDDFDRAMRDAIVLADSASVDELRARADGFTSVETWRNVHNAIEDWAPKVIEKPATDPASRFRLISARELAQPVAPTRWLVRGIWPELSAGVLAGDKKSLKTWNLQALALAVAAGTALFDKYHVTSPGGVLYLCGEGGRDTFANRHQVIAARYGIADRLPDLTFGAEFGVGTLTDGEFTDAVKRHLDELQPKVVILDPLYAYHPSDVEVQNVYARGPMLANLRTLIGGEAALIVGDHFNKTASGRLDLDNIAQAGMAQWADSWILQKHRDTPNLEDGKFWLEIETGTRRGSGKHVEVDWTLERDRSDPDTVSWATVDWDTRPATATTAEGKDSKTAKRILQVVKDNEFELTETGVAEKVGGRREKTREVLTQLKVNGWVVVKPSEQQEGTRMVKRDRVGLGETANRFRRTGSGPANSSPAENASPEVVPDDGTSSERVDP